MKWRGGKLWMATTTREIKHFPGPQWAQSSSVCSFLRAALSSKPGGGAASPSPSPSRSVLRIKYFQVLTVKINVILQCSASHIQEWNFLEWIQIYQLPKVAPCKPFSEVGGHKPAWHFRRFFTFKASDRKPPRISLNTQFFLTVPLWEL